MTYLLVGLGNPGDQYTKTRHNAGFWLLEQIASHAHINWREEKKFFGQTAKTIIGNETVHLLKPQTFMNASGRSVQAIANFYHLEPKKIIVIHDELDLPEGSVKLKYGGGHGGHNGLRDIIAALDSRDFYRIRVGIGRPSQAQEVVNYVLKPPSKAGRASIDAALTDAKTAIEKMIIDGAEKAMHWLHSQPKSNG